MLEVIVNVVPCGDRTKTRQVGKLQIINTGKLKTGLYGYTVLNCDVGEDSFRCASFLTTGHEMDLFSFIQRSFRAMNVDGIDLPRHVPKSEYVKVSNGDSPETYFLCVPWNMVEKYHTAGEYARFCKFMKGQTSCEHGVYSCDYERWLRGHMKNSQGADWD